jgi:hypothetical protein
MESASVADYVVENARLPDCGSGARENVEHAAALWHWILAIDVPSRHLEHVCVGMKGDVNQPVAMLLSQGNKIRENQQSIPQPAAPKRDHEQLRVCWSRMNGRFAPPHKLGFFEFRGHLIFAACAFALNNSRICDYLVDFVFVHRLRL